FAVGALAEGTHSVTAHFLPADASAFAASQSTPTTLEVLAPPPTVAGSLSWGLKSSFATYITGPVAHGTITTSGVGTSGGAYQFGQSGANGIDAATGTGSVSYRGSVRYTGHNGALDLTFA